MHNIIGLSLYCTMLRLFNNLMSMMGLCISFFPAVVLTSELDTKVTNYDVM